MKEERNKPQTFSADGWTGESNIFTNMVKKWARTPFSRAKNKWAEWLGRGEREGDKGPKAFCPGWRHQPGQKGGLLSRLVTPTGWWPGTKGCAGLLSRLEPATGIKGHPFVPVGTSNRDKKPLSPAGPASRWTRDKSHLLSRAQRLPGQMVWNKDLFCSSVFTIASYYQIMN